RAALRSYPTGSLVPAASAGEREKPMDQSDQDSEDSLSVNALRRICAVKESFEKAWQAEPEPPPRIEDFLGPGDGAARGEVVRLRVELDYGRAGGGGPIPGDYDSRFAGCGALIGEEIDKHPPGAERPVRPPALGMPRNVPAVRPRSPDDLSTMSSVTRALREQ